ncbi:EpsG family protein [Hydrogenophaga sp. RWCD_12]|uniref:EpsG family protein n=1 Tax=Hydrogenophaga sp. RWCD_12 TaxID=3391190 RepID=UPI0039853E53
MTVYLSIFLAMAFLGLMVKTRGQQDGALAVVGVFLLLFMGTRNDTGCDFRAYSARFMNLYHDPSYLSYVTQEEPGFHWLNLLVHDLGLSYMWLNVFGSLIFLVCLIRFVRLAPAPMLLMAIMFPVVILQLGMSGLRQALATAFLLQAMISFVHVRRINVGLWILVAAQFHHSAYLFLPLAMMAGRRFSVPMAVAAVAFLGPASVFLLGDRADVYSDRYVEQIYGENSSGGAVLRYALAVLPCVLFEFHTKRMRALFPKLYPLLRVSSLMTIALAPIGLLSTVALHRMTFYVLPVDLLIFICTVMTMPKPKVLSREWLYAPAGVLLTYLVGWFTLSSHSTICYVPYESFLF